MPVKICDRAFKFVRYLCKTMSDHTSKIAVCQFTATNNKETNLKIVQQLVSQAAGSKAQIVFLPEGCDYVANSKDEIKNLAEGLDGPLMSEYKKLAQKHNVWISIGGFHEIMNIGANMQKLHNSHILLNERGEIQAVYRKMHLFDVQVPEKNINLKESSYISKGNEIVPPINTPAGSLALSICYDLRFPELSIVLRKMGATILTFPSAFTSTTGQAHWEILLRARAIENQCYVVAAAQYGCHNANRTSFGQAMVKSVEKDGVTYETIYVRKKKAHSTGTAANSQGTEDFNHMKCSATTALVHQTTKSNVSAAAITGQVNDADNEPVGDSSDIESQNEEMGNQSTIEETTLEENEQIAETQETEATATQESEVIDPWGKIIAECRKYTPDTPTNQSVAIASIDLSLVMQVRREMPTFEHRRNDMYELIAINNKLQLPKKEIQYMFADKVIPASTVFYSTQYSYAFTNIRCVVPGHVLVSTIRQAGRLENLTPEEVADFFRAVINVQRAVERTYLSNSSTICVQDGQDAGQTIPHVHCHILPRKSGDFDRNDDIYVELARHDRVDNLQPVRSLEEMSSEANLIKSQF